MNPGTNGELNTGSSAEGLPLGSLEIGVLEACRESIQRNREMLPILAAALHVPETDVFYTWAFRRCRQRIPLGDSGWTTFFHGLECDLNNSKDGRRLRVDFGPGGRVD